MKALIRASLNQAVLINVLFVGLIIFAAAVALPNMPVDRFPNIQFGEVEVTTPYPGASAEEIEVLVTRRVEDALRGMSNIEWIRGSSRSGRSTVRVKFDDDTDYASLYDELRLRVLGIQNRLPRINNQALQPLFNMIDVDEWLPLIQVNLTSTDPHAPFDHRSLTLLAKDLRNRLEAIEGVRSTRLMGERPEQYELVLHPPALTEHGISFHQVMQGLLNSGMAIPAGSIDTPLGERHIRIDGRYRSHQDLLTLPLRRDGDGSSLQLGALLDLHQSGPRPVQGSVIQSISGRSSIGIRVLKTAEASAPRIKDAVVAVVEDFERQLGDQRLGIIYTEDNTIEIRDGMGVLAQSLLLSVVLVMVLLFLFLANRGRRANTLLLILGCAAVLVMLSSEQGWITALCIGGLGGIVLLTCRAAVLAVSGVVFSFLGALLLFWIMGYSLNEITLLGFILVSGIIVDDAIIVIENIQRHRESGKQLLEAVVGGTAEVFLPVVSAALTSIFAFLPLLLMTGSVGDFFALVPIAVATALSISLIEALVILPLHVLDCERILGPDPSLHRQQQGDDGLPTEGFLGWLASRYDRILRWNLAHAKTTICLSALLFLLAVGILVYSLTAPRYRLPPIIRSEFFPEDLSVLMLTLQGPEGSPLAETDRKARHVASFLDDLGEDRIWTVTTFAGITLDTTYKPSFANHRAFMMVKLPPREKRSFGEARVWMNSLREMLQELLAESDWSLELRPAPTGPPTGMPLNVRVSGTDETSIKALAEDLMDWLQLSSENGLLPGLVDLQNDSNERVTELSFHLNREQALAHAISEQAVQVFLAAATEGVYVGDFRRSDEDIPLRLRFPSDIAHDLPRLLDLPIIDAPHGSLVRAADLGHFSLLEVSASRERRDFLRTITITGDLAPGSPLSATTVVGIIEQWYREQATAYPGASIAFGGEAESTAKSYRSLGIAFLLAIVLIYAVLAAQFRSYLQPFLVLSNVVFSFTGVILLMGVLGIITQLSGSWIRPERSLFTVNSFIAIIGLSGLVVNSGIVLLDFINRRLSEGHPLEEAVILAAHQRMRPIVLTTLTTIAGLLPMAIGLPEFSITWGPFATSFVAGLFVSTAMTLLVLPVLYCVLHRSSTRFQGLLIRIFPHLSRDLEQSVL